MPLVGLHPIWALAVRPITVFGMSAVVGALLIVLRFVFKIPWAKMVFKEDLTWKKCLVLAVAGFVSALILAPLVSRPHELINAIKNQWKEHESKEATH